MPLAASSATPRPGRSPSTASARRWPSISSNTLPSATPASSMPLTTAGSPRNVPSLSATLLMIGSSALANVRCRSSTASLNLATLPAVVSPCAANDPPNSRLSSARMIFCAPSRSPDFCSCLICLIWPLVKVTPARCSLVSPLVGSLSALPTCIAVLVRPSGPLPSAVFMSRTASSVGSKASLWMLVKVNSMFSPDRMISSPMMALSPSYFSASLVTSSPLTPATAPVDLMTALVCACCCSSSFSDSTPANTPSTRLAAKRSTPRARLRLTKPPNADSFLSTRLTPRSTLRMPRVKFLSCSSRLAMRRAVSAAAIGYTTLFNLRTLASSSWTAARSRAPTLISAMYWSRQRATV